MSRKDRLFEIMQLLRTGDVLRACDLARTLEVSVRTIYRDMDTLAESGVPIEGTQGTGYHMTSAIALPPITLSPEELEALHLGITVLTQAADPALKAAAESLAAKIDASLPTPKHGRRGCVEVQRASICGHGTRCLAYACGCARPSKQNKNCA